MVDVVYLTQIQDVIPQYMEGEFQMSQKITDHFAGSPTVGSHDHIVTNEELHATFEVWNILEKKKRHY